MTGKTKVERRALVRGITAVPAAALSDLSSTLLPKYAVAQAANPSVSAASDRFEGAEIKVGDNIIFLSGVMETAPRCLWCTGFLEVA